MREIDPYVVAFFLFQTDKVKAKLEAEGLIAPTNPARKWAFNLLGIIAASTGDHVGAIYWYDRAIAADEKDNGPIGSFWRAIAVDEKDEFAAIAYINWGNALAANRELDKAIQKFELATDLDPKNAAAYNSWGLALGDKDKLDQAIEKFELATKLDSEYAFAYNNWGDALQVKGQRAEVNHKPDEAMGALAEAIEKFTRAAELNPEYDDGIRNIALILTRLSRGDNPDAFQLYAATAVAAWQRILDVVPVSRHADRAREFIEKLRNDPRYADGARSTIE